MHIGPEETFDSASEDLPFTDIYHVSGHPNCLHNTQRRTAHLTSTSTRSAYPNSSHNRRRVPTCHWAGGATGGGNAGSRGGKTASRARAHAAQTEILNQRASAALQSERAGAALLGPNTLCYHHAANGEPGASARRRQKERRDASFSQGSGTPRKPRARKLKALPLRVERSVTRAPAGRGVGSAARSPPTPSFSAGGDANGTPRGYGTPTGRGLAAPSWRAAKASGRARRKRHGDNPRRLVATRRGGRDINPTCFGRAFGIKRRRYRRFCKR